MIDRIRSGELSSEFLAAGSSSFTDFAGRVAPGLLPSSRPAAAGIDDLTPHGTTIVAATFPAGVVVAGDRRATMGNVIAQRDIEKVFPADEFSIIGIAGAAGIAVELVGLFQVELEHYEKIEGEPLSLVGKANRLATMIRLNLGLALQGLVVVPLFAGWDVAGRTGPDLLLRRHRRKVRGARLLLGRLRCRVRARLAEEALPAGLRRRGGDDGGHPGAVRRRRRRLRDRRSGPDPEDLPGRPGGQRGGRAPGQRDPDRRHGRADDAGAQRAPDDRSPGARRCT